jgi:hypothetical protein
MSGDRNHPTDRDRVRQGAVGQQPSVQDPPDRVLRHISPPALPAGSSRLVDPAVPVASGASDASAPLTDDSAARTPATDRRQVPPHAHPTLLHVTGFRPGLDVLSIQLGDVASDTIAAGTIVLVGTASGTDLGLRLLNTRGQLIYDRPIGTLDGIRPDTLHSRDFDLVDMPEISLRTIVS